MGVASVCSVRVMRRFLPVLAGTALLAGCGTGTDTVPQASTTAPTTSSSTTTTTSTASPSPTTTARTSTTVAPSPIPTAGATTPAEVIEAWLRKKGYAYSGDCADAKLESDSGKWCSTLSRDRGEQQTFKVGRVFSQYKYSLLLKKSGNTWSVVDVDEITVGP